MQSSIPLITTTLCSLLFSQAFRFEHPARARMYESLVVKILLVFIYIAAAGPATLSTPRRLACTAAVIGLYYATSWLLREIGIA